MTVEAISERGPRARLIRQATVGGVAARNAGIATVMLTSPLDTDDLWYPSELAARSAGWSG